jgi:hypothetical protein
MLTGLILDAVLSIIPPFMGKTLAWSGYLPLGIHPVIWVSCVQNGRKITSMPTFQ